MPTCYFCEQSTEETEIDPVTGDLHCHHCGKKLMSKGTLDVFSPEETPVPVEKEEEETSSKALSPPWGFAVVSFLLGAILATVGANYYLSLTKVETPITPLEQTTPLSPTTEEETTEPSINSLHLFMAEDFGDSVLDIIADHPDLFALSQAENHYGWFDTDLVLPFGADLLVQKAFYFFDDSGRLESLEYVLKPQEGEDIPSLLQDCVALLSQEYDLVEQNQRYGIWKGTDGFVGMDFQELFLYFTQGESQLRSIFS